MTIQHLVCNCNSVWDSTLPRPACPWHSAQIHNGLCSCRGPFDLHPFHAGSSYPTTWTTATFTFPKSDYVGKHRKPE